MCDWTRECDRTSPSVCDGTRECGRTCPSVCDGTRLFMLISALMLFVLLDMILLFSVLTSIPYAVALSTSLLVRSWSSPLLPP